MLKGSSTKTDLMCGAFQQVFGLCTAEWTGRLGAKS